MPEMTFTLEWPDGSFQECYSPSLVMHDHLREGESYSVGDFMHRVACSTQRGKPPGAGEVRIRLHFGSGTTRGHPKPLTAVHPLQYGGFSAGRNHPRGPRRGDGTAAANDPTKLGRLSDDHDEISREHHDVVIVGSRPGRPVPELAPDPARGGPCPPGTRGRAADWKKRRWDNFTLVTPNWQCQLPGYAYSGPDPDGFMASDEVVAFVRRYAGSFSAPVRTGVDVTEVVGGRPPAATGSPPNAGGHDEPDSVVIATGGYHRAHRAGRGPQARQGDQPAPLRGLPQARTRCPTAPCWWWAPASRAPRSPRTCTWRAARSTWRWAARRGWPAPTAAGTA